MKMQIISMMVIAVLFQPRALHSMNDENKSGWWQHNDIVGKILSYFAPSSGGDLYYYSKQQSNELIATFVGMRQVCKNLHVFMTIEKFKELFTHEELSYIYYNKIATYDAPDTSWLYLVVRCLGTTIQCPSPLLADWKSAEDKKFPDNKIPCEYFLAKVIHSDADEDSVLSVVKILVAAGTKVNFGSAELDRWLFQCVAHNSPLYNAVEKEFSLVVRFLVENGASIDEKLLDMAQRNHPDMYSLLLELQPSLRNKNQVDNEPFVGCIVQ